MALKFKRPKDNIDTIILDVIEKAIIPSMKEDAESIAQEIRQELVDRIMDRSFNFTKLSKDYKKDKDADPTTAGNPILVATGQYIESIQVRPTAAGYAVGVGDTLHTHGNSEPQMMMDIAKTLEYGSPERNIPPRPHWRPMERALMKRREKMKEDMKEKAKQKAIAALKKHLANYREVYLKEG